MGLDLGSLGSLNPLSMVGNAVKGVVGEIIPGPVGKLVGDVAAGVVDYETGNFPGMVQDGMSALGDLPQAMQSLQQSQAGATTSSEPAAPPPRKATPPAGAPPVADAAPAATGPSVEARRGVGHFVGSPPANAPAQGTPPSSSPPGTQGGLSGLLLKVLDPLGLFSNILGGAAGGVGAPTQRKLPASEATASSSSTKDVSSADNSSTSSSKGSTSSSKGSSSKSSKADPSTLSKDDFMALGSDAFMQAVVQGKIPKEITDSPAAMQSLQARMNNISEMNQLMTSMLSAVHQMEMSVIQNVRV